MKTRLQCLHAGARAAPRGLLPTASQWVPTPHLDRLLGKASAWWRASFPAAPASAAEKTSSAGGTAAQKKPATAASEPQPKRAERSAHAPSSKSVPVMHGPAPPPKQGQASKPKEAPASVPKLPLATPAAEAEPSSEQPSRTEKLPHSAAQRLSAAAEQLSAHAAHAREAAAKTGSSAAGKADDAVHTLASALQAVPDQASSAWQRARGHAAGLLSSASARLQGAGWHYSPVAAAAAGVAALAAVLAGLLALLLRGTGASAEQGEMAAPLAAVPARQAAEQHLLTFCTPASAAPHTSKCVPSADEAERWQSVPCWQCAVYVSGETWYSGTAQCTHQASVVCAATQARRPQACRRGSSAAGAACRGGALRPAPCAEQQARGAACQQHARACHAQVSHAAPAIRSTSLCAGDYCSQTFPLILCPLVPACIASGACVCCT